MSRPSIVVPAHNEASVIDRCIESILEDDPAVDTIVVVCNGCTDETASVARSFGPPVRVIETPVGSKPHALNMGDDAVSGFPRLYIDADVELSRGTIRSIVTTLEETGALACSPALRIDTSRSSWPVRSYFRIWERLPSIRDGLSGRGVYALSERGRSRFDAFPEVVADDRFIHTLFNEDERVLAGSGESRVRAPATTRDLVLRKARVFSGNQSLPSQLRGQTDAPLPERQDNLAWIRTVRESPRLIVDLPAYLAITLTAKVLAWWRIRRGRVDTWDRDLSSR